MKRKFSFESDCGAGESEKANASANWQEKTQIELACAEKRDLRSLMRCIGDEQNRKWYFHTAASRCVCDRAPFSRELRRDSECGWRSRNAFISLPHQ